MTKERDCKTCLHHTENGCSSWNCEYINRAEAIRIVKEQMEKKVSG